jgi:hypothetical protein
MLTDEHTGVRALLDGLRELDFEGEPNDLAFRQWQAWRALRARSATSLPVGDQQPPVSSAWSDLVDDPDRRRAFQSLRGQRHDGDAQGAARRQRLAGPQRELPRPGPHADSS